MTTRLVNFLYALSVGALLLIPALAGAQDYPNRRVLIIVPFGPGGAGDLIVRSLAGRLEQRWKQPILVDYRPGAGGLIAHEFVAKAPPDGYTLLQGATSFTLYNLLNKDLKFDPLKDLSIAAMTAMNVSVYVTSTATPARNWAEFVAYAKANPGKLNYGSLGRSIVMMQMELLSSQAGIKMTEVAYKGPPEYSQAVARNDVQLVQYTAQQIKPLIDEGRVTPLFAVSETRLPYLPNVPTNREVGLPNFKPIIWQSIMLPSATPRAIQSKLNADIAAAVATPEYQAQVDRIGMQPFSPSLDEIRKITDDTVAGWTAVARALNIKPE